MAIRMSSRGKIRDSKSTTDEVAGQGQPRYSSGVSIGLDAYNEVLEHRKREDILLALAGTSVSPHIPHPQEPTHGTQMLEDDRIITKQGSRFFPISLAADFAQVPRTTLLNWINAKVKFQGRPLQTYNSPTARKSYLKEESVERVAHRFVKWPSKEPAGPVVIGETDDHTGYIGISKAARAIGVDHHTIWLWVTQGNTPSEKPLDVIKCSASDQLYVLEKDVLEIKKLIPRSGLRRGRRARQAFQPL